MIRTFHQTGDWKLVKNETKEIEKICSHHNQTCHFLILMPQRSNRIEKREIEIETNFVLVSISVSHLMYNNGVSTEHRDRVHLQQQRELVLASILLCSITTVTHHLARCDACDVILSATVTRVTWYLVLQ